MKYKSIFFVLAFFCSFDSMASEADTEKLKLALISTVCWSVGKADKIIGDVYFSGEEEDLKVFLEHEKHKITVNDLKAGKYKSSSGLASVKYNECLKEFGLNSEQEKQAASYCYKALEIHDSIVELKDSGVEEKKAKNIVYKHYGKAQDDKDMLYKLTSDIYSINSTEQMVNLMTKFFYSCTRQVKASFKTPNK